MMQVNPTQLLMLLQWSDSAFPTGSFAHSGSLETYTQAEIILRPDDLTDLIEAKLQNAATTDLLIVHSAMSAYRGNDRARIIELDRFCSASKLVRESREASVKIGRRSLSSILNLIQDELLMFYRTEVESKQCAGHHAVVHGLACTALGVEPQTALLTFGYALAANQVAASLKLMSVGQTDAQAVLGKMVPVIAAAAESALSHTLNDFNSFTPGLDIRAMQHEHLFRRLFIS
jgi:urease accessory protein